MSYRNDRKVTDRPGEDTVLSGAEFVRTLNGKTTFYSNLHHAQRPGLMAYRSTYERQKEKTYLATMGKHLYHPDGGNN